ncbi:MAG: acetyl-CoA carboxylase biotin carboxyl carrier protein subunit [candidate division Zixibacteria bacterium]|nr:acetyl-CoA carboxylase biotin carboxyl carrier protein subunit [candidate division Zixibacteria bacterium]MBU2625861.1 acetyl-CoA carboxylase biotin carboxyl carrier protein subunit [candidate division Zixibacteria bacterium]
MNYSAKLLDKEYIVSLDDRGAKIDLQFNGKPVKFSYTTRKNKHRFLMLVDSMSYDVEVNRQNGKFSVFIYGREFEVTAEDERLAKLREVAGMGSEMADQKDIAAPMPGLVVKLLKSVGDAVKKGEGVIIIEAMKMENELKAASDGEIADVLVKPGQAVDKGQCLVKLKSNPT